MTTDTAKICAELYYFHWLFTTMLCNERYPLQYTNEEMQLSKTSQGRWPRSRCSSGQRWDLNSSQLMSSPVFFSLHHSVYQPSLLTNRTSVCKTFRVSVLIEPLTLLGDFKLLGWELSQLFAYQTCTPTLGHVAIEEPSQPYLKVNSFTEALGSITSCSLEKLTINYLFSSLYIHPFPLSRVFFIF